jgi:hypothetical protein
VRDLVAWIGFPWLAGDLQKYLDLPAQYDYLDVQLQLHIIPDVIIRNVFRRARVSFLVECCGMLCTHTYARQARKRKKWERTCGLCICIEAFQYSGEVGRGIHRDPYICNVYVDLEFIFVVEVVPRIAILLWSNDFNSGPPASRGRATLPPTQYLPYPSIYGNTDVCVCLNTRIAFRTPHRVLRRHTCAEHPPPPAGGCSVVFGNVWEYGGEKRQRRSCLCGAMCATAAGQKHIGRRVWMELLRLVECKLQS